jgi:hypothetical protein
MSCTVVLLLYMAPRRSNFNYYAGLQSTARVSVAAEIPRTSERHFGLMHVPTEIILSVARSFVFTEVEICLPSLRERALHVQKRSVWFYVRRPSLWSSGQSFRLQIQRSGFDSQRYQILWEVVGLERGPLSLVSAIEELLGRKSSGSCLEYPEYGCRDPSRWPRGILYPQSWHWLRWQAAVARSV